MKNNKGFTLIELVVTIALFVSISLLLAPKTIESINDAKNKGYRKIESDLKLAANKYLIDNYVKNDTARITKEDLINGNYINEIVDLDDKSKVCDAYVDVSDVNGNAKYKAYISCSMYETEGYGE